jgi:nitrogen PTS system EIIA component
MVKYFAYIPFYMNMRENMTNEIMTIEEVAEYLRVSERTVYDWAQKGTIPGGKLGTSWRFRRSDIEEWLDSRLGSVPSGGEITASEAGELSRILDYERVVFIEEGRKESALKTLCAVLAMTEAVRDERELEQAIFYRESLMSTGIGFGVAVPHVRLASVKSLAMALGIARQPLVDYESLDEVPIQIVCMVAANKSQHPQYIRALSAISKRLKPLQVREALIAAPHALAAYKIFTGRED